MLTIVPLDRNMIDRFAEAEDTPQYEIFDRFKLSLRKFVVQTGILNTYRFLSQVGEGTSGKVFLA